MTTTVLPVSAPIPSLARWGLTSDADLVFRTLATFGAQQARTLATELGLARQRVESALAELHECGAAAAEAGIGRTMSWHSRPVDEVVHVLRMRRMRPSDDTRLVRRHRAVFQLINQRLSSVGLPLDPRGAGPVADQIRYHPDRGLARQRIAAAMDRERHEHLVINNEESEHADVSRFPYNDDLFSSGISFR